MVRKSLSEQAYELIKADIITCALKPGVQIAQPILVERYKIGTTPIREAMQRLSQEGFVTPIPRFGYTVTPITFADVREIYELRSILESAAARLAAQRGNQHDLDQLLEKANFSYVYGERNSYTRFLDENAQFHRRIAEISGNQRLVDTISTVLDGLTRIFYLGLDLKDSAEEMRDSHIALANALKERDADQAERLVRDEVDVSRKRVLLALTRQLHDGFSPDLGNSLQI